MSGKEFFQKMMRDFFVIVTMINIAMYFIGSTLKPDEVLGYKAFLAPIIYGIISLIPVAVMYSKHELTVKQIIIRKVIQIILLEVILIAVCFGKSITDSAKWGLIGAFAASVFGVFVAVTVISLLLDLRVANDLTAQLKEFQEENS